ncbi:hypothetical protein [Patulibacter minatonensis]|uniref:hypothetical protein n=1 Tax=Patulibacter minatonensis TaxID=298163 RepID=UPI00047B4718|nr:hypothetical protein [Patulibacter minatonensis]
MDTVRTLDPVALLTPRIAGLLLALLLGCAVAVLGYTASVVLLGTSEAAASAIALACQALWQAAAVRWIAGPFRWSRVAHVACWAAAFGLAGVAGYAGGSAFFAVATVALVVMPAGALLCARRATVTARAAS